MASLPKTRSETNPQNLAPETGANIVLIGAPGSGKGTQSTRLAEYYNICQLSTGDLLRQAAQDQSSSEGKRIRQTIEAGGLVDDHIVLALIDQNISKPECQNGFLFDGFPRTIYQGEQLEKLLESKNKRLDVVLEYAIPDELLKRRILGRLIHKPSGRTYHEEFHPPKVSMKDDVTGESLERRSDDTTETLNARLNTYHKQTTPLIDFYDRRNIHRSIDASQKVNDVYQQSTALVDYLRQQPTFKPVSTTDGQVLTNKSNPMNNQPDAGTSRFSPDFLFVYKSVTAVLRDHGLI